MAEGFNKLETAILDWFKHAYPDAHFMAQIEAARFLKRNWTGVGFFTDIEVARDLPPVNLANLGGVWPINGPHLVSADICDEGDTLLWGAEGYIDCIEMYAYGEFFNEMVTQFQLSAGFAGR